MGLKRLICLICIMTLLLTLLCPFQAVDAAEWVSERVIHIVYDDSGSMYGSSNDRWSQALYAIEVFCTMMGSEDVMRVFRMSDVGANPVTIFGNSPTRVSDLVNGVGNNKGSTPLETVNKAGDALRQDSSNAERWLVVLTDGAFEGSGNAEDTLRSYADPESNIRVVYLAISENAIALSGDQSIGFYTYAAKNSGDILQRTTEIANQIFRQQEVPASHIQTGGSTMTLDIDIPVAQLLVFTQGQNASISGVQLNGTALQASEHHRVEVTQANSPGDAVAEGLCGEIQTYVAGNQPFEKGSYTVEVSDPANTKVYFVAGVVIDCCLTYNGAEVRPDEKHYAGKYGVDMRFIDPSTGTEVESDLLNGAVFTAQLTNNGTTQAIDSSTTDVRLEIGEATLWAEAVLPGNVAVSSSHDYKVYPAAESLKLTFAVPGAYKMAALGKQAESVILTVTKSDSDGKDQPLSSAAWHAIGTNLNVSCNGNVNWIVEMGDSVSTWKLYPDYITDMNDTDAGTFDLTVKCEYELEDEAGMGAGTVGVTITAYTASELRLELKPLESPIDLANLSENSRVQMTATIKDEYTGEYRKLTVRQADALELSLQASDLSWDRKPGSEPGIWYYVPSGDGFDCVSYDNTSVTLFVEGSLTDGDYLYQGSAQAIVEIKPLSVWDKLQKMLPYLIGFFVFLFLLIGYLCKKKLPMKSLSPKVRNMRTSKELTGLKIQRHWSTFLLPYLAQRVTIMSHQNAFNCNFANVIIKAAGNKTFYIVNIKSYANKSTRIDGDVVDPLVNKKTKYHTSTSIANYDKKGKAGEFNFIG